MTHGEPRRWGVQVGMRFTDASGIGGWSEAIEQVEAMGWELAHFTFRGPDSNRLQVVTQAYGFFRRVV